METKLAERNARLPALSRRKAALAVLKYAAVFLLMLPLSNAPFYGVRPFGTAFFLALLFLDMKLVILMPLYVVGEVLSDITPATLLSAAVVCGVAALGRLWYTAAKKKRVWILGLAAAVSSAGIAAALPFSSGVGVLHIPLYAGLCTAFAYCVRAAARPIVKERLRYKMLETEVICFCIALALWSAGLAAFDLYGFPLSALCAAYLIFSAAKSGGAGRAVIVALVMGAGHAIYAYDPVPIAAFAFIALVSAAFVSAPRVIMPVAGLAGYVMFRFFFFTDIAGAVLWIAAVAGGGLLYAVTPKAVYQSLKRYLFEPKTSAAVRYLINLNRAETAGRLDGAGLVFRSMADTLHRSESPTPDYRGSLKNKCCAICDNLPACESPEHESALDEMLTVVFKKGRALVPDIPDYLTNRCVHLGKLVGAASALSESRRALLQKNESDQSAKMVVAAQMRGMTEVLNELAYQSARPVSTDPEREKILIEELNYAGIAAAEALITGDDTALVLRTESFDRAAAERVVSKVLRKKCVVTRLDDTVLSGFCFVGLKVRPRYDMVFGASAAPKKAGELSGDTHSFIKVGSNRFMMALCDGMGSGAAAEKTSETAIGLVENFYRAGFSGEVVLKSVNRFLSRCGSESFSALDICMVDLDAATADIIKLGSPASYVKRKQTVERVDGCAAPMGVLDPVEPSVITVPLSPGDMLVLVSDGVSDSFEGDRLSAAVNNMRTVNPQTLSAGILEHVMFNNNGNLRDDSTVLAAKLIEVKD